MSFGSIYLESVRKRFRSYKAMGDKTLERLDEAQLHWQPDPGSNSVYQIVRHVSGNMQSRWTDFLTTDGEKPWRNRDTEFEESNAAKAEIIALWEKGWSCLLQTLDSLQEADLEKTVHIRTEPHAVIDAINRQLAHIPSHVGQIMYIAKMLLKDRWESLSIPKGKSEDFNRAMSGK
ncbi:DUF1572 family protein [Chitinophaga japonensis]|uniref:Uncharacterized protein DUF1572 n=1 Tax=Chitinophaga japonensis TaxID=104662 RepID=A0A562T5P3_CHIJA|nr:DUF1572 family protein [Chitinophaga japonensis]TWI88861.1 uncharacterized protein DUF1572 [Chitinophaga japonensis]